MGIAMRFQLALFGRLLTTFALLVAFAAVGFAHTSIPTTLSPELQTYVDNGGSLTDLCSGADSSGTINLAKCETCHLIGGVILPSVDHGAPKAVTTRTTTLEFVAKRLHNARPLDPSSLSRAPPAV